ncbi:MAG TPA: hypothetical protein VGN34_27000 [Ktedonobacteraceae bacterium]
MMKEQGAHQVSSPGQPGVRPGDERPLVVPRSYSLTCCVPRPNSLFWQARYRVQEERQGVQFT